MFRAILLVAFSIELVYSANLAIIVDNAKFWGGFREDSGRIQGGFREDSGRIQEDSGRIQGDFQGGLLA
ncbi:MAG: hypothetical protein J6K40_03405 [Alistipes sp.]|nr:hypothetical protein [Alistipes sp.]